MIGDYNTTETVDLPFNTFTSNDPSESSTITDFAATDVHIHKDGSVTQRSSSAGVTISINFDGATGAHVAHIDLSDNTDAGYYSDDSVYMVRIEGVTVDAGTLNPWIGVFSIGRTLRPTTAGRTLDILATGEVAANLTMIMGTLLTETAGLLAAGFKKFFNIATPTGTLDSLPDVVPGAAGGLFIAGANAATTAATLSVTGQLDAGNVVVDAGMDVVGALSANSLLIDTTATITGATILTGNVSMADGLTIPAPSTGNRDGLEIVGNGTGAGVAITGGSTSGNGMTVIGGAPDGIGIYTRGDGTGAGLRADGGGTGPGIYGIGSGNADGANFTGAGTGDGISAGSGAGATGNGITALANSTNGSGMSLTGAGSGEGLEAAGGATGAGLSAISGGAADGIYCHAATTGHGLHCVGGGTAGDGINADGDTDGDGITAIGVGAGQVDINADITGDITGTITTVTGNVDGNVGGNVTGNVTGTVGELAAQAKADVNAEVLDVMGTDTHAEPGQEAPAHTTTLTDKINYLYKLAINKKTETTTEFDLYDNTGVTVDQKSTVSDAAGVATQGELVSGP